MKVIAASLQKGGCGKTTTVLSVGQGLRAKGKRVLFIDTDFQCSLTDLLGGNASGVTIADVIEGRKHLPDAIVHGGMGDYVPSSQTMSSIDMRMRGTKKAEYVLKKAIGEIPAAAYDYVLIDTPPAYTLPQVMSLTAADGLIIPVQADRTSFMQLQTFLYTVSKVQETTNPDLDVIGCIVTRWSDRIKINAAYYEAICDLMESVGVEVIGTVRECSAIRESQGTDGDLFEDYKGSNAAKDYRAIVRRIIEWTE